MLFIEGVQGLDVVLQLGVLVVVQQHPIQLLFLVPLRELAKLLPHEQQLLAGVGHHVAEEGAQVGKLSIVLARHLVDQAALAVHHFIVADGQHKVFAEGIEEAEGDLVVVARAEERVGLHVAEHVVHPAHVPLEVEAQAAVAGRFGDHGPCGGLLRDHALVGVAAQNRIVQLAQESILIFHRLFLHGGKLFCRSRFFHHGQAIQLRPQGGNVGRGSAAAAAQDLNRALGGQTAQLPCKVLRPALILHLRPGDNGITRVGHDRQGQRAPQLLCQCAHGTGCRHAVQAHGIHDAAFLHPPGKVFAVHALPGVAVGQDRKGHQHKGIRHFRLDGPHGIQKARIGAQGLEQEIPGPQRRELLCHSRIYLPRRNRLGIRSRAEVGKNGGTRLLCGLHSQLPACLRQLFPAGRVCRRQPGQAEGIRLDGISPCRQILPVDSQHPRRVGQVGLLALHPGSRLIISTHGTIKKQGAGL